MKTVSLSGSLRENVGKKDASLLRRSNRVPAVLYGGEEQVHFHIEENDANKLIHTPNVYIIELDIDGNKQTAILQETQFNPVTDRAIHMDFLLVTEDKPVRINIPVSLNGFSVGVRNGGKLAQNFRRLKVEGLAKDLPDTIDIDITDVKIGDKVRVSDMTNEGIKFLNPATAVVVAVQMARGATTATEEEEEEEAAEEAAAE